MAPGYDYVWDWPAAEVLDPYKEAMATKVRLESLQTTYAEEYAKRGLPWMDSFQQAAIERGVMRELGLSTTPLAAPEIKDEDEE
jgi:capsid protein